MIKRTIITSDIHGCYDEFSELLSNVGYNKNDDKLILLGDYISRGPKSKEMIEELIDLSDNGDVIILGGNHEEMFLEFLKEDNYESNNFYWVNGGKETIESYCKNFNWNGKWDSAKNIINTYYKDHIDFISNMKNFYEDENHIYVHAGINPSYDDWKDTPERDFRWIREDFHFNPVLTNKTIFFGHTLCSKLHGDSNNNNPWISDNKIGIDGACSMGGQLNCIIIDNKTCQHLFIKSKQVISN